MFTIEVYVYGRIYMNGLLLRSFFFFFFFSSQLHMFIEIWYCNLAELYIYSRETSNNVKKNIKISTYTTPIKKISRYLWK